MAIDLTVIVKNTSGDLVENATVSATPEKVTGKTNAQGEASLELSGSVRKYDITVIDQQTTQTVPFYVTEDTEAARLEVNLQYFKQLNSKKANATTKVQPDAWYESTTVQVAGGLSLVVLATLITVLVIRRRKKV